MDCRLRELADTHCHLDQYPDADVLLRQIAAVGPEVVCMTLRPGDYPAVAAATAEYPRTHAAVGLIPQEIEQLAPELDAMLDVIRQTRFVGEVGLDYVTDNEASRRLQRQVFSRILAAAADAGNRIVSIHSRRAAADTLAAIGSRFPGVAILHWYSGPLVCIEEAPDCVWFSVNSAMVTSRSGKERIALMPADRLLLETDGPYIRHRDRPVSPLDLGVVVERLAAIRGWSIDETVTRLQANWQRAVAVA